MAILIALVGVVSAVALMYSLVPRIRLVEAVRSQFDLPFDPLVMGVTTTLRYHTFS